MRRAMLGILIILLVIGAIWIGNYVYVGRPVDDALQGDPRNVGVDIRARLTLMVNPAELVLDLRNFSDQRSPADLWRALFQAAEALARADREFETVVLSRSGRPVFLMDGADFQTLGHEFEGGQNPVYLLRTLPEKLLTPAGRPAYDTWTGGLLGVVGEQMEDINEAALAWIVGEP